MFAVEHTAPPGSPCVLTTQRSRNTRITQAAPAQHHLV